VKFFGSVNKLFHLYTVATVKISNFSVGSFTFSQHVCHRFVVFRSLYTLARLSVVCLSVTLVHLTQPVEIFGNISKAFGTLTIRWHPRKTLRGSSQGNPSVGRVKHNSGSQI